MTYGRTLCKQLKKVNVEPDSWHELAAVRAAWRETLQSGVAPPAFRPRPPSSPPLPLARTKPARSCTRATLAAIDATLRTEAHGSD